VHSGSAIDTRTVGAKEFTVTATDNAGNSNTVTRHYTVAYAYTAISPGKTTSVNAGSGLSVKIQLKDYDGNNVVNAVAKLDLSKSTTTGWAPEQNATSKSNMYNDFSYSPSKGQYTYNLDTKPLSPGTWQLRIKLDDGTTHTLLVNVKK
jgi:hypothetical protein